MYENRNKRKKKVLTKSKFTFAAIKENEEILQQTFLTKKKKIQKSERKFLQYIDKRIETDCFFFRI